MGNQDTKYAPEEESHDFDDGRNMESDFYVAALGLVDDDAPSADWTYISGMTFSACTLKDANDAAYAESYDSSDESVAATATDAADNHNSAPASATSAAHVQAVVATVIHPLDLASSAGDQCQIHQCMGGCKAGLTYRLIKPRASRLGGPRGSGFVLIKDKKKLKQWKIYQILHILYFSLHNCFQLS